MSRPHVGCRALPRHPHFADLGLIRALGRPRCRRLATALGARLQAHFLIEWG
jgi:hypothetical protein